MSPIRGTGNPTQRRGFCVTSPRTLFSSYRSADMSQSWSDPIACWKPTSKTTRAPSRRTALIRCGKRNADERISVVWLALCSANWQILLSRSALDVSPYSQTMSEPNLQPVGPQFTVKVRLHGVALRWFKRFRARSTEKTIAISEPGLRQKFIVGRCMNNSRTVISAHLRPSAAATYT